ncbi:MAG: metallophosphoesterase family protein [Pyrinomonadaceae bacterium]
MSEIATLLHVSDFHFDGNLTEQGRRHWRRNFGVKSHGFGKIDALSAKFAALEAVGLGPDLLLATGDISTDGAGESFEVAREFIESKEIQRGTPDRLVTVGLGMNRDRRIIVPGNHDRYAKESRVPYQNPTSALEAAFQSRNNYPYAVAFRRSGVENDSANPALLFFVFDSTAPERLTTTVAPWVRIARGRIENAECRWLASQIETITKSGRLDSLDGGSVAIDYENAVRIAVLHHHPIMKYPRKVFDRWTQMENAPAFVNACFDAGMDLVLFGHEHQDYWTHEQRLARTTPGKPHGIYFICCPSTAEFSETNNGFFYIDFNTDHFVVRACTWNGKSFIEALPRRHLYDRRIAIASRARN